MIDPRLKARLRPVARRDRSVQLSVKLAAYWAAAAALGFCAVVLQWLDGRSSSLTLPIIAFLGLAVAMLIAVRHRRIEPDWRALARRIEAQNPELDGRLLTAVQQEPGAASKLGYLQERVLDEAIQQSRKGKWARAVPWTHRALAHMAHLLAFGIFLFVVSELRTTSRQWAFPMARTGVLSRGITVTPGDTSLERGCSLVVLARFGRALPASVELVVGQTPQAGTRIPLVRSLADPVFGGSVSEVTNDFLYHIEYAGERTRDFKVTVFEHPRLERADADLSYPAYTGQPAKHIENTRRLSAVEGSKLDLALQLNKPVVSARLVSKDKDRDTIPLLVETNCATAALKQFPLETSKTWELQLVDADGRTNKTPAQFVFDALKNRAPELRVTSPRGDTRPSALEEMSFEGTVWDDFGVQAYGLAYTLIGQEPKMVELGRAVPAKAKHPFQHVLRLEDLGVQPDQLISWFVWADDLGPDGQVRRTTGDLFFAEVRPFEEVFRERQGGESSGEQSGEESGQQGNKTGKLADLQKQIISATWKLWRGQGSAPATQSGANNKRSEAKPQGGQWLRTAQPRPGLRQSSVTFASLSPSHAGNVPNPNRQQPGASQYFGASERSRGVTPEPSQLGQAEPSSTNRTGKLSQFQEDTGVVRESQAQALEQAETAKERIEDPRLSALWEAATKEMEKALEQLKAADNSPALLKEALSAEQAAYQALLKLQEREYAVQRSRNRSRSQRGNSSREQQMQRQLDQMDLTQSENRYETQSQAQAPPTEERREQLQVMNRLQELARRQQDVNDRLKELQTALQEARTDQEREEIRRQLKRLQEEEQQMLADMDELRQRMDRPENQSRMAEQRQRLEQTRQEMQRAAQAAEQGSASQALAAGTRAQSQMQQLRDAMRKESSSQFSEDLRRMRAEARELARRQEEIQKQMDSLADPKQRTLSDSDQRKEVLDQLEQQKGRLTNLVEQATQVSQQAEGTEPLVSRELYDTLRKFSQQDANSVKELQEELLKRGILTRSLYERLKQTAEQDGTKSLELTSEMLRQDYLPQANLAEERARAGIGELKRGVERAAEKVLGDDTETLRLAREELERLTEQLEREILLAQGGSTNGQSQSGGAQAGAGTNETRSARAGQARANNESQRGNQQAQAEDQQTQSGQQAQAGAQGQPRDPTDQSQQTSPGERSGQQTAQGRGGGSQQSQDHQSDQASANPADRQDSQAQQGRSGDSRQQPGQRGDLTRGGRFSTARGGPEDYGGRGGRYRTGLDDLLDWRGGYWGGPILGEDFAPWSDRLREVEEMVDQPELRNQIAVARERARLLRQEFKRDLKRPDWAVVRLQVVKPLVEVRNQLNEELARREPQDKLVPIDRDPVPIRYSELVRRYYEELGKEK